jgi:tripartite-type tricarboxylate transporter receptor subunit TctC
MKGKILYLAGCFFLCTLLIFPAAILAAPYYEGKLITIVVGHSAGGGNDVVARLVAKHLPNHIPGKPSVVVQNMLGASGMIAANHVYGKAKPDGLTLLATDRLLGIAQLLKADGVRYDFKKFSWAGSVSSVAVVLFIRSDLPYKTFNELKTKKPVYLGGTGPTGVLSQMARITKDFLGLDVKLVDYRGSTEIVLAIEQKELDGFWSDFNTFRQYAERGLIRPIVRSAVSLKGIENLPVNEDLTTDPTGKAVMGMLGRTAVMGRVYLAPPGTPDSVMNILREALAKMLKDPELQADAKKIQLELDYISAEECVKVVNYMFNQPPEILKVFGEYVKF